MRVAVQPCGNSVAGKNYEDTIQNLVPKERILKFLDENQAAEFEQACGEFVAVWGVTKGKNGVNKRKWEKLNEGDVALLYRDKRIFSSARIALCMHNEPLAKDLWSTTDDGTTWEYVYFLDELQEIDLPISYFNEALGYKPNNIVQGFNVYEGDKAAALLSLLDVDYEEDSTDVVVEGSTIAEQIMNLQSMDIPSKSKARAESKLFRQHLFGNNSFWKCDLCGKELPISLLVAAHVKKRADCSDEEKKDVNNVMSACRLGCDELFEKSFIHVDADGMVQAGRNITSTKTSVATNELKAIVQELVGKMCAAFNEQSATYFEYRRTKPLRIQK